MHISALPYAAFCYQAVAPIAARTGEDTQSHGNKGWNDNNLRCIMHPIYLSED